MKAPDKIYVPCSKDCSDCVDIRLWTREPLRGGHEYIRKDALLAWAKEEQELTISIREDAWWDEVINKLKSM